MAAYINLIAYTTVTLYQLYLIWTNRYIRQRYGRSRTVTLWTCLLITLYFSLAYVPIAFRLVGPEFAPVWIRPFFWLPALAVGMLAWYIHNDQLAQEEAAAERARLDTMRQQIVTNVAHELRTPLTVILGYSRMLIDDERPLSEAVQREFLEAIWKNARRLFLGENRIMAAAQRFDPVDTDLVALVKDVVADPDIWLVTRKRPGDIEVTFDDGQAPLWAHVSESGIRTAVFQLVHNAIKWGKPGGFVSIFLSQTETETTITVADDGVGIDEMHHSYIFEMLSQVNGSSIRAAEGMGMGLWVARELVQMHGGSISVQSERGQGSVFTIALPRKRS